MRLETFTLCCVCVCVVYSIGGGAHEKWVKRADGREKKTTGRVSTLPGILIGEAAVINLTPTVAQTPVPVHDYHTSNVCVSASISVPFSLDCLTLQAPCMKKKWKISRERKKCSPWRKVSFPLSLSLLIYSAQGQHRPAAAALYLAPPPSILRHSSIFFFLISLFRRHLITWCVGCVTQQQQQPEEEVLSVYFYFFLFRVKIYFFCFCSLCRESRRRRRRDFDPNSIMTSST